jgi:hypothetical protein
MESTICKVREVEKKLERSSLQKFEKTYSRRKESESKFCGDR